MPGDLVAELVLVRIDVHPRVTVLGEGGGNTADVQVPFPPGELATVVAEQDELPAVPEDHGDGAVRELLLTSFAREHNAVVRQADHQLLVPGDDSESRPDHPARDRTGSEAVAGHRRTAPRPDPPPTRPHIN
ncbi:hypothetical protein ACE14D_20350, partial [Streptomyces sp. Act-28]